MDIGLVVRSLARLRNFSKWLGSEKQTGIVSVGGKCVAHDSCRHGQQIGATDEYSLESY